MIKKKEKLKRIKVLKAERKKKGEINLRIEERDEKFKKK